MRNESVTRFGIWALFFVLACQGGESSAPTEAPAASAQETSPAKTVKPPKAPTKRVDATELPDSLPNCLLLSYSQFQVVDGKATAKPGPARLDILTREGAAWKTETIEDAQSNVFHKAMMLTPRGQAPGILTLGGSGAYLKLWRRAKGKLRPSTLWQAEFGGKFNRMRDAEVCNLGVPFYLLPNWVPLPRFTSSRASTMPPSRPA